jgi:hypothetical protein
MSAVALAADEAVSGTVQNVDPQQGRITVRAEEDKVLELRAPAELLIGLQSGAVGETSCRMLWDNTWGANIPPGSWTDVPSCNPPVP